MIDSELDPIIERIAREARRPVVADLEAKERLLAAVRAEPAPGSIDGDVDFSPARPATIGMTASRIALFAAGLVGIGALLGFGLGRGGQLTGQPVRGVAVVPRPPASDTMVTFVFVAHNATKVSVVGDFNQWDAAATPMERIGQSNAWTVTVPIAAGRHLYSFFAVGADGEKWVADPHAPAAPDNGFGRVNSIVFVGKGSS